MMSGAAVRIARRAAPPLLLVLATLGTAGSGSALAADGRIVSDGPFTLDATEEAGGTNALTLAGGALECPGSSFAVSRNRTRRPVRRHDRRRLSR